MRASTPFGDRVYVHHASLDAKVRRAVESNFTHAEAALCFATSTLELGIDIGDVDLIVLIGALSLAAGALWVVCSGTVRVPNASIGHTSSGSVRPFAAR